LKEPVHVLLFELPALLSEIFMHRFRYEEDLEIAVHRDQSETLIEAVKRYRADIVMTGANQPYPLILELLRHNPRLKLFNIWSEGRQTLLCELYCGCEAQGQLSPDDFVARIRELVNMPFSFTRHGLKRDDHQ
jgi:hypothetical protein